MIIFFTIFLFLLIARANSYLLSYEILNIDESQMMANAVRFDLNKYNIFDFDGTSSGFLNSLVLNWPNIFGLDVTFLSTRLTAIFILSIIFYLIFLYFKNELGKFLSILVIAPGLIFFSFTNDPDYQHYSSELLSTLFIVFCLFSLKTYSKKPFYNLMGFLPLGLILFSKSQIIPTAISLYLVSGLYFIWKKNFTYLYKMSIFFLLPIIFIISLYFFNGYISDYYINYFEFSKAVVSKYSLGENINTDAITSNKEFYQSKLIQHLLYNSLFHYFYFQILISILILFSLNKKIIPKITDINLILITACIGSVFFSILLTGVIYRHYLTPLVPLTTLFVGYLFTVNKNIYYSKYLRFLFILLSVPFLTSLSLEKNKFYAKELNKSELSFSNINFKSPKILDFLNKEKVNLFVWGWAPQWYVLSYKFPSDRATISQKNIEDYSNKDYFDKRLLKDFNKNLPSIVIDAVKPNSFYYTKEKNSLKVNSPIKNQIIKHFTLLNENNPNCLDIYLHNNDYNLLKKRLIEYDIKNSSIKNKLDDYSISEDVCDDSHIFGSEDKNILEFNFDEQSDIKNMLILASRKNKKETMLEIKLIKNKKEVNVKKIKLRKYPFWTNIDFNENFKDINSVNLDVKILKDLNYGLNEIKFYRK